MAFQRTETISKRMLAAVKNAHQILLEGSPLKNSRHFNSSIRKIFGYLLLRSSRGLIIMTYEVYNKGKTSTSFQTFLFE